MYKQIIFLSLLATVVNAEVIGWRDCGSHLGDIYRIRIDGCTHTPCRMVRGNTYLIEVDASSRTNSNNLPFAATAMILGIPITLLEGNACDHLRIGNCPAFIGQSFTFSINFEVPALLPPISTVVNTYLWNDYGDVGVCLSIDLVLA